MKRYIRASKFLTFTCPNCHNNTLMDAEREVTRVFDIGYHDIFVCEECVSEFWGEPQYDNSVKFVPIPESE